MVRGGVGDAEKGSWKEMIPGMDAISGGRIYTIQVMVYTSGQWQAASERSRIW